VNSTQNDIYQKLIYPLKGELLKELLNEAVETKDTPRRKCPWGVDLIEKLISDFSNSIQYKIQTC
jgi:hypothetical protein